MIDYKPPVCKPKLREFSEYGDDGEYGRKCYVNPDEVMAVKEYRYHSYRPAIGQIILRNSVVVKVWETVEEIRSRLS